MTTFAQIVAAVQGVSLLVTAGSLIFCVIENRRSIASLQDGVNAMASTGEAGGRRSIERNDGDRAGG